jgi:uncharacterized protein (TIGR02300 family)
VAKPEWGIKRVCHSCSTKFYDLEKEKVVCPSCGEFYDPEIVHGNRREKIEEAPAEPVVEAETEKDEDALDAAVEVEVEDDDADENDDTLLVVEDDDDNVLPDVKPFDDSEEN